MCKNLKDKCECGNLKRTTAKQCLECFKKQRLITHRTKGELKLTADNWWRGRLPIARDARKAYARSDKPKQCCNCGYDKHYEVCHIKPVSEFSDDTLISEINHVDNLVALCPNCHWEYDNGLLEL